MPRKKLHYKEGDWFALPLEEGGYALGLIARMTSKSTSLLGYFFGHRFCEVPTLADAAHLRPSDAIDKFRFGDLRLLNRNWPVLGSLPGWDRQQWPVPEFADRDIVNGRPRIRTYDDVNLNFLSERWAQEEDIAGLPPDGLYGALAAAERISRLIRQQEQSPQPDGVQT